MDDEAEIGRSQMMYGVGEEHVLVDTSQELRDLGLEP
jgi:hypothetical protein